MRRKLLWIDAALLVLAVTAVLVVRNQWRVGENRNKEARARVGVMAKSPAGVADQAAAGVGETPAAQLGSYNVIFERNLFSPNRIEFEPVEAVAEVPATPPMPGMPVLNGVTVVGTKRMALIQEPRIGNTPQNRTVQVGDSLMGSGKVTEIRPDALVFSWGPETHVIDMINGQGPKAKAPIAARLQTTVITVGSSRRGVPAASGGQAAQAAAAAGPTIQLGVVGQGGAPGAAQAGQANAPAQANRAGGITQAGAPRAGQAQQGTQQNQTFIDTPFGRIARQQRTN